MRRKKLLVDKAQRDKDIAYDQLKLQIASLYVKITNNLVALKTASENAAIYIGAGTLTQEQFHNGNMSIEEFAVTKQYEQGAVSVYQNLQTTITTDIITLEILTHTPIITNTTTDITLDDQTQLTKRQRLKENKRIEADIKKSIEDEDRRVKELKKLEKK